MHSVETLPQSTTTKPRLVARIPKRGGVYLPTPDALAMRAQIERWAQGLDGADDGDDTPAKTPKKARAKH